MKDTRYLRLEHDTWLFVRAVPKDLIGKIKSEKSGNPLRLIVKSTEASSLKEAKQRRDLYLYETQRWFQELRARRDGKIAINPMTGEEMSEQEEKELGIEAAIDHLRGERYGFGREWGPEWVSEPNNPLERVRLEQQIMELEAQLAALKGEGKPAWELSSLGKGIKFSTAAAAYLAERQREPGTQLSASSLREHKTVYRLFASFADDPTIGSIDRKMASTFLDVVSTLDPGWGKYDGIEDMPLKMLVQKFGQGERGLSNNTLNHYVSALSSLWRWLKRKGDVQGDNPFNDQSRRIDPDAGWTTYTPAEIKTLLQITDEPLRWYVLIGLYSGMRLGEICAAEIGEQDGVVYFEILAGKTKNARRRVPVHSELLAAGILRATYRTMTSAQVTNAFNRLRQRLGLIRDRLSFHSLRKCFVSALDRAAVSREDTAALVGHSRGFSFNVYSSGPGLIRLRGMVEQVRYSC